RREGPARGPPGAGARAIPRARAQVGGRRRPRGAPCGQDRDEHGPRAGRPLSRGAASGRRPMPLVLALDLGSLPETVGRSALVYATILTALRLTGKRHVAQL